jgi:hypothetical protein
MAVWTQLNPWTGEAGIDVGDPTVVAAATWNGYPVSTEYLRVTHVGRVVDTYYRLQDPTRPYVHLARGINPNQMTWYAVVREDDGSFSSVPVDRDGRRSRYFHNTAVVDASPGDLATWRDNRDRLLRLSPAEEALERIRREDEDQLVCREISFRPDLPPYPAGAPAHPGWSGGLWLHIDTAAGQAAVASGDPSVVAVTDGESGPVYLRHSTAGRVVDGYWLPHGEDTPGTQWSCAVVRDHDGTFTAVPLTSIGPWGDDSGWNWNIAIVDAPHDDKLAWQNALRRHTPQRPAATLTLVEYALYQPPAADYARLAGSPAPAHPAGAAGRPIPPARLAACSFPTAAEATPPGTAPAPTRPTEPLGQGPAWRSRPDGQDGAPQPGRHR